MSEEISTFVLLLASGVRKIVLRPKVLIETILHSLDFASYVSSPFSNITRTVA